MKNFLYLNFILFSFFESIKYFKSIYRVKEWILLLKKVLKLNAEGSLAVGIPKKFVSEMQLTENDALSVVLVGHTLHITKIKIE